MSATVPRHPECDAPMHLFTGSIKYTGTQSAKYVIRHRPGSLVTSPSTL